MTVNRATTIPALFHSRVSATPTSVALQQFDANRGGIGERVTWSQWRDASTDVAGALISSGAHRGEMVAILASNTTLWPIADVGVILAGLVSVGIDPAATEAQVQEILVDCAASVVIVEGREQLAKVRSALQTSVHPPLIVAAGVGELEESGPPRVVSWKTWLSRGRYALVDGSNVATQLTRRSAVASPDDLAMLIYTWGATGAARGARITHAYVVESARAMRDSLGLGSTDTALSFLPFCSASERIFGLYTRIACGMTATLLTDAKDLWSAARIARPTLFAAEPHSYEEVYATLLAARQTATPGDAARWDRALDTGGRRARLRREGGGSDVPSLLEEEWSDAVRVVRPILARSFGDALRLAISVGGTLSREAAEYLDALGVTVLSAYGETEHLCITFNRPEKYRHDSVGIAMPGTYIAIASDGEVLVRRGDLTFAGYHRRSLESQQAFTEDGVWLRTGDRGELDSQGFLRIHGRVTRDAEIVAL